MNTRSRIALIAHDGQKQDMVEWAVWNRELLATAELCGTQQTAKLVSSAIGAPSGTRSSPKRMKLTSARCSDSPSFTMSRSPAIGARPI